MEDERWLLRRFGLPILLLLIFVIVGVICCGKIHEEEQKGAEEVWEPPIEMENSEAATEADVDALQSQHIGLFRKPVIVLSQMRKRNNCRVWFCQRQIR